MRPRPTRADRALERNLEDHLGEHEEHTELDEVRAAGTLDPERDPTPEAFADYVAGG